jgi:hypothetical protein
MDNAIHCLEQKSTILPFICICTVYLFHIPIPLVSYMYSASPAGGKARIQDHADSRPQSEFWRGGEGIDSFAESRRVGSVLGPWWVRHRRASRTPACAALIGPRHATLSKKAVAGQLRRRSAMPGTAGGLANEHALAWPSPLCACETGWTGDLHMHESRCQIHRERTILPEPAWRCGILGPFNDMPRIKASKGADVAKRRASEIHSMLRHVIHHSRQRITVETRDSVAQMWEPAGLPVCCRLRSD